MQIEIQSNDENPIKRMRSYLEMTQERFSDAYGIPVRTLQQWEAGRRNPPDYVINLAAQAGVRYSITNPASYIKSNMIGFYNILEACRATMNSESKVEHLVYASSSSVYGSNKKIHWKCLECGEPWYLTIKVHAKKKKCLKCKTPLHKSR